MNQPNTQAARQIEIILRKFNSLSTLASVAARFVPLVTDPDATASNLGEIISSDPALTARILALAGQSGISTASVDEALSRLGPQAVRDAVLSVKVFQAFDAQNDSDSRRSLSRSQLALHALAVACCSREIARSTGSVYPQTAFTAGLLHDIGKIAIDDVMPKSMEKILHEAQSLELPLCAVEYKYLGLDHALIGKRLGQKWNLPDEITTAIWLHHSDPCQLVDEVAGSTLARIVYTANLIASSAGFGSGTSFSCISVPDTVLATIGLDRQTADQILSELPGMVEQKGSIISLGKTDGTAVYCGVMQNAAQKLFQTNAKLTSENRSLQGASAACELLGNFIASIRPNMSSAEVCGELARIWQLHFRAGPVCCFIRGSSSETIFEAAWRDSSGQTSFSALEGDWTGEKLKSFEPGNFVLAGNYAPWIFDQAQIEINAESACLLPIMYGSFLAGAIVFETTEPIPQRLSGELGKAVDSICRVMFLSAASHKSETMSEKLTAILGRLKDAETQLAQTRSMLAVAEIAAGAAHELNNPLAVISGRAQLLASSENDLNRKQMLKQIEERAGDISNMIAGLMTYAKPPAPVKSPASIKDLIEGAVSQVAKNKNCRPDVSVSIDDSLPEIHVDAGQVTIALANIIANATESYIAGTGPVEVSVKEQPFGGNLDIKIRDRGCGMDADTVSKAANPFFSAKLAGRKRGMGLSHAYRFIELNGGKIKMTSAPGKGTTIDVLLPAE